ncbi:MAG: SMP-30/gluconolactonase/LRE family protein [Hyphomicrobiales bacterium]|nr:MAG: SMP-30/gluconolactonase/LRE family protein [Hyphomicrobiales bacterium]
MQQVAGVLSEVAAVLGEGIAVNPMTGALAWFDIPSRKKLTHDFVTNMTTEEPLPEMGSAGAAVDADTEMVFLASGLWRRQRSDGALERLAAIESDRPDLRSNDGRTHPCGAFWCSTMALDKTEGAGSIYWFFKGELRQLYTGLTVGNAICFAEDGSYAHFSDTPRGTIWRVATDPATGLPIGEPEVFHQAVPGDPSGPDGAVLDRDGRLYSARWGGARVDIFDRDATLLGEIATGGPNTTCPAFCGPALSWLAITTARDELSLEELARHPQSGKTFIVDIGCRGRLDPPVRLG